MLIQTSSPERGPWARREGRRGAPGRKRTGSGGFGCPEVRWSGRPLVSLAQGAVVTVQGK